MIKKLILTCSFAIFMTIAFSGASYATHETTQQPLNVSQELHALNELLKEGAITKEEFEKVKSILLDPESDKSKIKKKKKKKPKLTAAEREQLKAALEEEQRALKEQLREEKRAERERLSQASLEERKAIIDERNEACADDPTSKACKKAKMKLKNIYERIKLMGQDILIREKKARAEERQAAKERKERIKADKEHERQATLAEQKKLKAERAERTAERKRRKAEWKRACSEDPNSKACLDGKPSQKIKNVLKKIEERLGG